jgi:tetratricopeptide (TPR) repeat protein
LVFNYVLILLTFFMKNICTTLILLLFVSGQAIFAQTDNEKALAKGQEAIALMDKGQMDESIKLLEEAHKLDPKNSLFPYEMGYAYYLKQDYKTALKIFQEAIKYDDITDQYFQMLGNLYDFNGDSVNALKTYDEGLKKFPKSGALFLEKGNIYWGAKNYGEALSLYEQGIEAAPKFASNYYRATRVYLASSEKVWGMIYGEIFMNLERNSQRTAEISKLLYDTYKNEIKFTSKSSMTVSFCHQMTIDAKTLENPKDFKIPFCMVYEPTLLIAVAMEKKIDINSLDRIRKDFVESYFKRGHDKSYPNILFDFQKKLLEAGHLEAYNHWILMKGDEDGFGKWKSKNNEKMESFIKWFTENKLQVDDTHRFYRGQY